MTNRAKGTADATTATDLLNLAKASLADAIAQREQARGYLKADREAYNAAIRAKADRYRAAETDKDREAIAATIADLEPLMNRLRESEEMVKDLDREVEAAQASVAARQTDVDREAHAKANGGDVCGSCAGSGKFYAGGAVVNGVYTGKVGICFRCGGKGYQTKADSRRNWGYDRHYRRMN